MEQHVGRKLSFNEVVHHINNIRTDNRIENLQLMDRSEHCKLPRVKKPIKDLTCMTVTMLGEKAYRLKHIAHNIDRSIETIRRHVRSGGLKAYKNGGEYYVVESDLIKYLKGEEVKQ